MCLTVLPGCKPQIAKHDITCWKYVVEEGLSRWSGPYYGGKFEYGKRVVAEAVWKMKTVGRLRVERYLTTRGKKIKCVDEGFHSFMNPVGAWLFNVSRGDWLLYKKLKWCVIPKGAEYCKGRESQMVSTDIVVFRSFGDYLSYIFKRNKNR